MIAVVARLYPLCFSDNTLILLTTCIFVSDFAIHESMYFIAVLGVSHVHPKIVLLPVVWIRPGSDPHFIYYCDEESVTVTNMIEKCSSTTFRSIFVSQNLGTQ